MDDKNYWLHRCENHEGGLEILDRENRLTIGFADCANEPEMVSAIQQKNDDLFNRLYEETYGGEIWRSRWNLWHFTCEMSKGDIVVVPRSGGFSICQLKNGPLVSSRRTQCDIGFEWEVELLTTVLSPRESYAPAGLLSRMKCRQTTLKINDLADEIASALERYRAKKPFSLPKDLAEQCYHTLTGHGSPDHFEQLVQDYFIRLGAKAEILPKNYSGKEGDCDVSAVFSALHLTISVQIKKHEGITGKEAVNQILAYAKATAPEESNWTYVGWVISLAEDFSDDAKEVARKNGIILLNGKEFCSMLIANGIGV